MTAPTRSPALRSAAWPATLLMALLLCAPNAWAADTSAEPPKAVRPAAKSKDAGLSLVAAQAHLGAQRFEAAVAELKLQNASGSGANNADWNNLMGFALRKQAVPDLDGAQRHYDAALRIAPQHQGALEYAGELALMKGDLATAEKHLARLKALCSSPCEPLDDLAAAVTAHKAKRRP